MKKLISIIFTITLVTVFLSSCGAKPDTGSNGSTEQSEAAVETETADNSIILGTWFAQTAVYNGEEYKAEDMFNGPFLLMFKDNGECRMQHNDEWSIVKWELHDSGVTLTGDDTYELSFADGSKNKLLMDINGAEVTLEKYEED